MVNLYRDDTGHGFVTALIEYGIHVRVYRLENRKTGTYALAVIVAAVIAQYMLPDEKLHLWVIFVEGALSLAVCVLVLEASMLVMLPAIQAQFRVEDISNVIACVAVILGACGFMARLIQCFG